MAQRWACPAHKGSRRKYWWLKGSVLTWEESHFASKRWCSEYVPMSLKSINVVIILTREADLQMEVGIWKKPRLLRIQSYQTDGKLASTAEPNLKRCCLKCGKNKRKRNTTQAKSNGEEVAETQGRNKIQGDGGEIAETRWRNKRKTQKNPWSEAGAERSRKELSRN